MEVRLMEKEFTVTGTCTPDENYMVDISSKLEEIKALVDKKNYFTINRGRQYGKTTVLTALETYLEDEYIVISLTFEDLGDESFVDAKTFCQALLKNIADALEFTNVSEEYRESWKDELIISFDLLSDHIKKMCKGKKVVLMIDEVDKVSNNRVFLNFLSVLRKKFLARKKKRDETFHSVILAGVYDIKNIKLKMINDGIYTPAKSENHLRNSPWNIAVDFDVDMSFNPVEIATMLIDYEKDYQTGMDVSAISGEIYSYTSGYPFMVSRLCQIIHDEAKGWDVYGVRFAVSLFLREDNQLFKDMAKNIENNKQLYELLYSIIILRYRVSFTFDDPLLDMAYRYGYIKFDNRYTVSVFNKIFETRISYYFVAKNILSKPRQKTNAMYHNIATVDYFNMELCLEKFAEFFNKEIFPIKEKKLLEEQYRLSFLSFLKPLLNGEGHFHQESELINDTRMDLVVNYGRHEYIVELKRIFAESDRTKGIEQLLGYMEGRNADVGYYLTFDFRKKSKSNVQWLEFDGKRIFEVSV